MSKLSLGSGIPLYLQIESWVIENIEKGIWKENDKLPSEGSLAQELNVHRLTLREAFSSLVRQGYLERVHGKGVFVKNPLQQKKLIWQLDTLEIHQTLEEYSYAHKVLIFTRQQPMKIIAQILGISTDSEVFYIERLRMSKEGNHTIGLEKSYLPCHFAPDLNEEILAQSKYRYLTHLGYNIDKVERLISPISPSPYDRKLLGLTSNDTSLKIESSTILDDGKLLEYSETVYNANVYKFSSTAYNSSKK